jgi:hypothetical protein
MKTVGLALAGFLVAVPAFAQPADHPPDPVFKVATTGLLAAHGADLWSTGKCIGAGTCHEINPALRPLEGSGVAFGAVKMAIAGAQVYALERLHRKSRAWGRISAFALAAGTFAIAVRNNRIATSQP